MGRSCRAHGAAVIVIVAAVTLATRFYLRLRQSDGLLDALSDMSQYFTILTNALTLLMVLWSAFGRDLPARLNKVVIGWDGLFEAVAWLVLGFAVIGLVMTALGRFAPLCELKKRVSLHQGSHWT